MFKSIFLDVNKGSESPNKWDDRKDYKVSAIVVHITDGNFTGSYEWIMNEESAASYNYLLDESGEVFRIVDADKPSWHAGAVKNPSWKKIKKGVNPNLYTVGVAFSGFPNDPIPLQVQQNLPVIIGELCEYFGLPCTEDTIVFHREIRSDKTCPGSTIDKKQLIWWSELYRMIRHYVLTPPF